MLSAKRCGSTSVFRIFQRHPEVGVCHTDQHIDNWEPNFWNLGAAAIDGAPQHFIARFKLSHPFLKFPDKFTDESLFRLWDDILNRLGPAVFDKSPQYLGNQRAFELIQKYAALGNDVRLFAFIRDPRDAITSQYELWRGTKGYQSPCEQEQIWLKKYNHLDELHSMFGDIPIFRYEKFASDPATYATDLLRHCGCAVIPQCYEHIKPTSVGRYSASFLPAIRMWKFSDEFKSHLTQHGYQTPQISFPKRLAVCTTMLKGNIERYLKSIIHQ